MSRVLDSAELLLAKEGLHALDMRSVGELAGVTTGAIYARFSNKEALLASLFDRFESDNEVVFARFQQRAASGEFSGRADVIDAFLGELRRVYRERGALIAALIEGSYTHTEFVHRASNMMSAAGALLAWACEQAGNPTDTVNARAASRIAFAWFDQQLFLRRGQIRAPADEVPIRHLHRALLGVLDNGDER